MSNPVEYTPEVQVLVSLALIDARAVAGSKDNDRLGMFMPFVIDALNGLEGSRFSLDDVITRIRRSSGLELPMSVVKALLSRLVTRGELVVQHDRYARTQAKLTFLDISSRRKEIEKDQEALIAAMCDYAKRNGAGIFTEEQVRKSLGAYLEANFRSLSVGEIPELDGSQLNRYGQAWIAKFFLDARSRDQRFIETATTLIRGRILYDAAFLPGFGEGEQHLSNLVVYLDSPILCRALGLGTEEDEALMLEAIAALKSAGADCLVLEQTVSEISRIMRRVYESWGHPREDEPPNSYLFCMPQRGLDRDYANRISSDPSIEIRSRLGLKVVPSPPRVWQYVWDEAKLEARLENKKRNFDGNRVWHDIDCVAATLTTRQDEYTRTIASARAFFATQSYLTMRNVSIWWREDEHRDDLSPMISIVDLANYAWLYDGSNKSKSIARESLIAACAASVAPSERAWRLWSQKLAAYVEEERLDPELATHYLYSMDSRVVVSDMEEAMLADGELSDIEMAQMLGEVNRRIADKTHGPRIKGLEGALNESTLSLERAMAAKNELQVQLSASENKATELQERVKASEAMRAASDEKAAAFEKGAKAFEEALRRKDEALEERMRKKARQTSCRWMVLVYILFTLPIGGLIAWQAKVGVDSDGPMFLLTLLGVALPVCAFFSPLKGVIEERYVAKYRKEWLEDHD